MRCGAGVTEGTCEISFYAKRISAIRAAASKYVATHDVLEKVLRNRQKDDKCMPFRSLEHFVALLTFRQSTLVTYHMHWSFDIMSAWTKFLSEREDIQQVSKLELALSISVACERYRNVFVLVSMTVVNFRANRIVCWRMDRYMKS